MLIDRDGVINIDLKSSVCNIDQFRFIPGSMEAIAGFCTLGYKVIIITNQACIGRNDIDEETVNIIHEYMCSQIQQAGGFISDIFICPHTPEERCECRKPLPGMIIAAQKKYNFILKETIFVGDALRDIQAAEAAGCNPVLVRTGRGLDTEKKLSDVNVFDDLHSLYIFLKKQN